MKNSQTRQRVAPIELEGKFLVHSFSKDTWYLVDVIHNTCDCENHLRFRDVVPGYQCKHIKAVLNQKEKNNV